MSTYWTERMRLDAIEELIHIKPKDPQTTKDFKKSLITVKSEMKGFGMVQQLRVLNIMSSELMVNQDTSDAEWNWFTGIIRYTSAPNCKLNDPEQMRDPITLNSKGRTKHVKSATY